MPQYVELNVMDKSVEIVIELDKKFNNEKTVLEFLERGHYYEPDVSEFITRVLKPGDIAVDAGANIGYHTLLMAKIVGKTGKVISFEPGPNNLPRLKNNLALNHLSQVELIEEPLSSQVEEVTLWLNSDDTGGNALWDVRTIDANVKTQKDPQKVGMLSTTLDAQLYPRNLIPKLIKLDIEGAEYSALKGGISMLTQYNTPYIISELNSPGLEALGYSQMQFRDFMWELGYDTFLLYFDGSLPKLVPRGVKIASKYYLNLLFASQQAVDDVYDSEYFDPTITRYKRRNALIKTTASFM